MCDHSLPGRPGTPEYRAGWLERRHQQMVERMAAMNHAENLARARADRLERALRHVCRLAGRPGSLSDQQALAGMSRTAERALGPTTAPIDDATDVLPAQGGAADGIVTAPFTAEQVASLNDFQLAGALHPFTCPLEHVYRWRPGEIPEPFGNDELYDVFEPAAAAAAPDGGGLRFGSVVLVASAAGWVCPNELCRYTQDWAHTWMADRSWAALHRQLGGLSDDDVTGDPPLHA